MTPHPATTTQAVSSHELTLRSRQILDLGSRQKRLLFLAGLVGIVLVAPAQPSPWLVGYTPMVPPRLGSIAASHYGWGQGF